MVQGAAHFLLTNLGNYLIVIKRAELVGTINNSEIYHITETDIIPYKKTTLHLTERQVRIILS